MVQTQRNSVGALLLIGLGVLFLVGQVFNVNLWEMVGFSWPVFVLIPGVIFLALALTGDRKMAGFAVPGTIITGTGAILWYQNVTNNWESWAYIWTLYPVFVGVALMFMGRRTENDKEYSTGRGFVTYGLIAFVVGAAFFELFIFRDNGALTGWLLPVVLIGVGAFMLLGGSRRLSGEKPKTSDFSFSGNGHRSNGRMSESDKLRQQIDEVLAEDDPTKPEPKA